MKNAIVFLFALLPSFTVASRYLRSYDDEHRELQAEPAANPPFIEKDGLVVMEAENVPIVGFWRKEQAFKIYTGDGYLRFNGNTILNGAVNSTLSYFIQINNPGTYIMDMRARKNNTNTGLSNDAWVRLVGHPGLFGTHTKSALGGRSFAYHYGMRVELQPSKRVILVEYTFPAPGIYEFQVSGRSMHFVFDRIIMYNLNYITRLDAEKDSQPESQRLIGAQPLQHIQLVSAGPGTSKFLTNLKDGDVISFGTVGTSLSIIANTFGEVGSVLFQFNGQSRTETSVPYQLNGGSTSDTTPSQYLATPGVKTVTITVFDKTAGVELAKQTVRFTLTPATGAPTRSPTVPVPTTAAPVPSPTAAPVRALSSLDLVTARGVVADYTVLQQLTEGAVLDQSVLGKELSVLANVAFPVAAVHFFYGGRIFRETTPIYAMIGNENNSVFPVPFLATTGSKTLTVKAYRAGLGTTLVEIDSITVKFRIIAGTSTPVAAPVLGAPVSSAPVAAPVQRT